MQEALQVMEAQGDANLFFRQVEELNKGMEDWEDYGAYRENQLRQHVSRELDLVKKTTFLFIPQGSLRLDEPP